MSKNVFGHALGAFVSPIVECVDVDGVLRRIDVDDVVNRINLDQVIDRIDINRLLDRITWDRHLERIDLDAVLSRMDVEKLVLRSNVGAIVAQSTTGIITQLLDAIRCHVVVVDLFFLRFSRTWLWRSHASMLPQKPAGDYEENHTLVPEIRVDKAIAVQGRYTGFFAKAIAIFIDVAFVTVSFGMLLVLFEVSLLISEGRLRYPRSFSDVEVDRDNRLAVLAYILYWFNYFFLLVILTGQTLGMAIVGIKLVTSHDGMDVTAWPAIVRTLLLPVTLTLCPLLGIIGACRRDGRMLHDLIAGTGTVYKWNARLTKLRERVMARMEQQEVYTSYPSRSESDDSEQSSTFASVRTPILSQRSQTSSGQSYNTGRMTE
jgi:uncharacterized RDD family membrane protein YckC